MRLLALALLVALSAPVGCSPASNEGDDDDDDSFGEASSSGSSGEGSSSGGSSGSVGSSSGSSGSSSNTGPALADGTLLYVRRVADDKDVLVARDLDTDDEHIVTDLKDDGGPGWDIAGYSLSADRRRFVVASLYGPTAEDTATGLATNAIWTFNTDGSDFRRLTPTFPNHGGGKQNFQIEVDGPFWSADGSEVFYDYGEWWWENQKLQGGTRPWSIGAGGGAFPSLLVDNSECGSIIEGSRHPVTGELLYIHSVCIPGQGSEGFYLYSADGSNPRQLVRSAHTEGNVDVYLEPGSWFSDGSGFAFIGSSADSNWELGLYVYVAEDQSTRFLKAAPAGAGIRGVTVSADSTKIVYCLDDNRGASNLHLLDLTQDPVTDTAITSDGKSRAPQF